MEKTKRRYTLGEELLNAISHGAGALLAVAGSVLLIIKAADTGGIKLFSVIIYSVSMLLMYTGSTIYHSLALNGGKKVMRVLDHCFIYLLIIGTYAPFTLVSIGGATGYGVFAAVFTAGALGITLTAVDMRRFSKFCFVCYLVMGWAIVFAVSPLVASLNSRGLILLVSGGVVYTLGAVVYLIGKKYRYIHGVWHFFVLAGSVLHFLSVYYYVY